MIPWDVIVNGAVGLAGLVVNGVGRGKDRSSNERENTATNALNVAMTEATNRSNEKIAEETNASNEAISTSTNEANKAIADAQNKTNKEIAEANIAYQNEYNKEIWKREDEQAQKEWDFKLSHGINPLADYTVNGMGAGGTTNAPQSNQEAVGYTAQGYTAQGYNTQGYVIAPNIVDENNQLGNTIMMMSGMMDNLEANRKMAEEREGISEDNEGKKIENEYKETGLLLDLQEKKGKIQELKDKHRINEAEAKELEETLDLKIESLKKSLELDSAKIKETEANTNNINKSTEKVTEEIKTEQKERYLNEIMSKINQDIANEQLDMARQTHADRVKQEEQNTYFNKLRTDKMKAECVKTWIESGEIISSEARQWLKFNLGKKAVRKNFTDAQLGRLSLLLGI